MSNITKDYEKDVMAANEEDIKFSLAYRGLTELPSELISKLRGATYLDLSYNEFSDLHSLFELQDLSTLILDNNLINSHTVLRPLPKLKVLWLNRNDISNLSIFIQSISLHFPNLSQLCMMNNTAAPSYFNGGSVEEYQDYRHYVISHLPKLCFLDDSTVTRAEREEACRVYGRRLSSYATLNRVEPGAKRTRRTSSVQTLPRGH